MTKVVLPSGSANTQYGILSATFNFLRPHIDVGNVLQIGGARTLRVAGEITETPQTRITPYCEINFRADRQITDKDNLGLWSLKLMIEPREDILHRNVNYGGGDILDIDETCAAGDQQSYRLAKNLTRTQVEALLHSTHNPSASVFGLMQWIPNKNKCIEDVMRVTQAVHHYGAAPVSEVESNMPKISLRDPDDGLS